MRGIVIPGFKGRLRKKLRTPAAFRECILGTPMAFLARVPLRRSARAAEWQTPSAGRSVGTGGLLYSPCTPAHAIGRVLRCAGRLSCCSARRCCHRVHLRRNSSPFDLISFSTATTPSSAICSAKGRRIFGAAVRVTAEIALNDRVTCPLAVLQISDLVRRLRSSKRGRCYR